jgi:uncharacterized membrane protein YeiB
MKFGIKMINMTLLFIILYHHIFVFKKKEMKKKMRGILVTHGRNILLNAIMLFLNSILFSVFSLFITELHYKRVFLIFSIVNVLIGICFVSFVYRKLYVLMRDILKEDTVLNELLKKDKE